MIDSQSVRADAVVATDSRGFDGGKLINGRKRHVLVDTLGLLLDVRVTAAYTGDRTAAHVLHGQVRHAPPDGTHLGRQRLHRRLLRPLPGHARAGPADRETQ
ncbi:transposase [Streptomyces minutiscleroticus]|uniref:transposase n=1 Tax=Streptomyces minutiscleroticus TaxID=68238 RepID=UPI00332A1376